MAEKKTKTTKKTEKAKKTTAKKNVTRKSAAKKEEVKLNPLVWEVPYNEDLVAQFLYVYNNNERKGTVKQKTRGEVSGGGRKPWKQKGTGRARHGSIRSPLWIGGGVTFAASDKNFKRKINKKMAKKATRVILSERLRNKDLEFVNMTPTKGKKLRQEAKESTLVISDDEKLTLTLRNSKKGKVLSPEKLNAKHVIAARKIFVDEKAVKVLEQRLANEK